MTDVLSLSAALCYHLLCFRDTAASDIDASAPVSPKSGGMSSDGNDDSSPASSGEWRGYMRGNLFQCFTVSFLYAICKWQTNLGRVFNGFCVSKAR